VAQPNILVHTGNKIRILFDDVEVGLVQALRATEDYAPEPASGIGEIEVQEYIPTMARYNLAVTGMALRKQNMIQLGIYAVDSQFTLQGLVFDIAVYDRTVGADANLLRRYNGCSFASGDLEFTKHAIVAQNANFVALRVAGDMIGADISAT
jgi:hypothetical protein